MSDFDTLVQKPVSKKIILAEFDIAQDQEFWTNYRTGVWYVNFENNYPDIDSSLLGGVEMKDITRIGSVKVGGESLFFVGSASAVQINENSFYYSGTYKSLYIHCENGDEPGLHIITIGEAIGVANHAGYYNRFLYEGRLKSAPSISKAADLLFYGKISFEGGNIVIDNTDGKYDSFAEDNDVYGNDARILVGFDDLEYADFVSAYSGLVEDLSISPNEMVVGLQDKRKYLSIELPVEAFDDTTYPDINEYNIGKPIPIGYGVMKNVPVICVNEEATALEQETCDAGGTTTELNDISEDFVAAGVKVGDTVRNDTHSEYGTITNVEATKLTTTTMTNTWDSDLYTVGPENYDFKLCDTTYWSIKSIDEVRVEGVVKTPSASSLTAGTFTLATSDYVPGDAVTCDYQGYEDGFGNLIENACDVIVDLMTSYTSIKFNNNFFDTAYWEKSKVPDINYFLNEDKSLVDVIEELSSTARGYFIVRDDGRYAYRVYSQYAASMQTIEKEELLNVPIVEYDPAEILTSTKIGYAKDWANDEHLILVDKAQEEAINKKYNVYKEKFFPTLLKNSADAQKFSDSVLELSGEVTKRFSISVKTQIIKRSLIDLITVAVNRRTKKMFGYAKAVIVGVDKDIMDAVVSVDCRVVRFLPDTVYEQSSFYDDAYYNDAFYGITQDREIED